MRKIFTPFKLFLTSLLMVASATAFAEEVTFTPDGSYPYSVTGGKDFYDQQGSVTMTVSSGTEEADQYRVYKSQTVKFTSADANIIAIVFTCTANGTKKYGPGCFETSVGEYAYDSEGPTGTWTGSASEVVFTASTNQVRFTSVVVTLDDGSTVFVQAPSITPATGTYTEAQTVSITAEEGTTAYYSLNGGDFQAYSAPFQVSETTTVTAYAQDADGNKSSEVSSVITIVEAAQWQSIAEVTAAATSDGVFGTYNVSEATVIYANGYYAFITDGARALLVYGNSGLTTGLKVTGTITGSAVIYKGTGSLELSINVDGGEANLTTVSEGNTVSATAMDIADIKADMRQFESQYVALEGVTFASDAWDASSNRSVSVKQGDEEISVYNQFKLDVESLGISTEKSYDVKGIVCVYGGAAQLYLISLNDVVEHTATGIGSLQGEAARSHDVYTVGGQKASALTRGGLYIVGGKKVYVK